MNDCTYNHEACPFFDPPTFPDEPGGCLAREADDCEYDGEEVAE